MGQQLSTVQDARAAVEREAWPTAYGLLRRLADADADGLTQGHLDALSDAAWWLCRVEESIRPAGGRMRVMWRSARTEPRAPRRG